MNITFTSGSTYTTSSSHCWSAVYLFSGCSSVSNAVGTSGGFTAEGHNLIVTQKLWESGILLFDAYPRQCAVTSEYYYQADAPPHQRARLLAKRRYDGSWALKSLLHVRLGGAAVLRTRAGPRTAAPPSAAPLPCQRPPRAIRSRDSSWRSGWTSTVWTLALQSSQINGPK